MGGGKRAEIQCPILFNLSDNAQARVRFIHGEPEAGILLIIAKDDVVTGQKSLNKITLKDESLLFVCCHYELEAGRPLHHDGGFMRKFILGLEVG